MLKRRCDLLPAAQDNPEVCHSRTALLLLLHLVAAVTCFTLLAAVPIAGCIVVIVISDDPGGPLFLPVFVLAVLCSAFLITGFCAGAAALSDLLRQKYKIPLWVPPMVIYAVTTFLVWLRFAPSYTALSFIVGGVVTLAYVIYWASISFVWFLPKLLLGLFTRHLGSKRVPQIVQ